MRLQQGMGQRTGRHNAASALVGTAPATSATRPTSISQARFPRILFIMDYFRSDPSLMSSPSETMPSLSVP